MSAQQRVIQLSAASLAVVLIRDEDCKHGASSCSGPEVFADFKSQNSRSFWNKRLVNAVDEVSFQGWLENCVLLVQGDANNLEVLREAWMRRALRSPTGFNIKAVGDLSPVQMSSISQSQFIPLSEILCSVISDMNAANVVVNQEALIKQMMKAHPGMSIPTQDILYNALGTLIKERKIYHTGEGYFVVTPQTYFITSSMVKEKNWWCHGEGEMPSPPPITYLVSNESCMDTSTEVPIMPHCKSCSCFSPLSTVPSSVQDHQSISISECTGKSLKWPKEHKPSFQNQSTSTAADCQASEMSNSSNVSRKDKEKAGRKFGLSLFRRNTGKKENKLKKEYATFSGQFPPEEWPVRDEDDLNNLPRDLEHAIIKRINPDLTVDNLVKHTVLMKKLEEKAEKAVDKGISTEALWSKQRLHIAKSVGRKSAPRTNRSRRRGNSNKERLRARNKTFPCVDLDNLNQELAVDDPELEQSTVLVQKCVYKKRIENPFPGLSGREVEQSTQHKEQRRREAKIPVAGCRERIGHRSKSWDPHRSKAVADRLEKSQMLKDKPSEERCKMHAMLDSSLDVQPMKELYEGYGAIYNESCTLRIEDKIRLRENSVQNRDFNNGRGRDIKQDEPATTVTGQKNILDPPSQFNLTEALPPWPKPSVQRRFSLHLLDKKEDAYQRPDLLSSHQQLSNLTSNLSDGNILDRNTSQTESEAYTDDDHRSSQKTVRAKEGNRYLCLDKDGTVHSLERDWNDVALETHAQQHMPTIQRSHEYRWRSSEHQTLPLVQNTTNPRPDVQAMLKRPHDFSSAQLEDDPSEGLETSIFDYCQTSEVESDSETVQKITDEASAKPNIWNCHPEKNRHQSTTDTPVEADNAHSACLMNPNGPGEGKTSENRSNTADSGIDSPRTHMSVTSSNSVILGLKHRGFLQNLEKLHSKGSSLHAQSSLLTLTPVMNV